MDDCPRLCDEYSARFDYIRAIHKCNGGLASARNAGLDSSNADYVAFVDSDDYVSPGYVALLFSLMSHEREIAVFSYSCLLPTRRVDVILPDKTDLPVNEAVLELYDKGCFNVVWNKLYRRDIIERNQIRFHEKMEPGEDILFNCLYFRYVKHAVLSSSCGICYVQTGNAEASLSHKFYPNLYEKNCVFIGAVCKLFSFLQLHSDKAELVLAKEGLYYFFKTITNMYRTGKTLPRKERLHIFREILGRSDVRHWFSVRGYRGDMLYRLFWGCFSVHSAFVFDAVFYSLLKGRSLFRRMR